MHSTYVHTFLNWCKWLQSGIENRNKLDFLLLMCRRFIWLFYVFDSDIFVVQSHSSSVDIKKINEQKLRMKSHSLLFCVNHTHTRGLFTWHLIVSIEQITEYNVPVRINVSKFIVHFKMDFSFSCVYFLSLIVLVSWLEACTVACLFCCCIDFMAFYELYTSFKIIRYAKCDLLSIHLHSLHLPPHEQFLRACTFFSVFPISIDFQKVFVVISFDFILFETKRMKNRKRSFLAFWWNRWS